MLLEVHEILDVDGRQRKLAREEAGSDPAVVRRAGRWAIERRDDGRLLGWVERSCCGCLRARRTWRSDGSCTRTCGATAAPARPTRALANWAFSHEVDEIIAVVRPGNTRAAATVRRKGMEWVGETDKYFGVDLHVFRLRRADFDPAAAMTPAAPAATAE